MLNKEEEHRVNKIIDTAKSQIAGTEFLSPPDPEAVLWLATNLKETNDELKKFKESAKKYSKEDIQPILDVYKNPKNEISDRFYPR